MNNNKKKNGQFFTMSNPFNNDLFYKWFKLIPNRQSKTIIEPFAGSNNIVKMINDIGIKNEWVCYDIEPPINNNFNSFLVNKLDCLNYFPKGFDVAITNPPYLAKNSATRDGIDFPDSEFDDLYKHCLKIMLDNVAYVSAIIPESFITQNLFHSRLFGVISLTCKMFDDTECPVCLALFIPEQKKKDLMDKESLSVDDFYIYKDSASWGKFSEAKKNKITFESDGWKFNVPTGSIGLFAIDNTTTKSIRFVKGSEINSERIKVSSRGITRIENPNLSDEIEIDELIEEANRVLDSYRLNTNDIFLTSFRGLTKDGLYRRRLDFSQAKNVLSQAVHNLELLHA